MDKLLCIFVLLQYSSGFYTNEYMIATNRHAPFCANSTTLVTNTDIGTLTYRGWRPFFFAANHKDSELSGKPFHIKYMKVMNMEKIDNLNCTQIKHLLKGVKGF
jgi:hypothetical protein